MAEAMVCKDITKPVQNLTVHKYRSGERYKIISKSLNVPWGTVKAIDKWRNDTENWQYSDFTKNKTSP